MIKFSLIMPAYNSEKYICEAIESVVNQSYTNWELIIVNDGSTDNTAHIIKKYESVDDRIIVINQSNSGTAAAARNVALSYVSGDYVQMLDSDDCIKADMLQKYSNKLKDNNFDIIIPNCRCFKEDDIKKILWEKKALNNDYNTIISGEEGFCLSLDWRIHGCFCIRTPIIVRNGYDSELINGDEFSTRKFLYSSSRISFCDTWYYYRLNCESTTKNKKNNLRMFECLLTDLNIYEFAKKNMSDISIDLCERKLIRALVENIKKYAKECNNYTGLEKEKVKELLRDVYINVSKDMWKKNGGKYKLLYYFSLGKYKLFLSNICLLCFLLKK